jgi:hypothetical protein
MHKKILQRHETEKKIMPQKIYTPLTNLSSDGSSGIWQVLIGGSIQFLKKWKIHDLYAYFWTIITC